MHRSPGMDPTLVHWWDRLKEDTALRNVMQGVLDIAYPLPALFLLTDLARLYGSFIAY